MKRKVIAGVIILVLLLVVIVSYSLYSYNQNRSQNNFYDTFAPSLDVKNATYQIEGQTVTLKNGVSRQVTVDQESSSAITTKYFGNEVKGDFNADGQEDIAFLLTQETGGSGTFYYLVTLLAGSDTGTNALLLGDRISPQSTEYRNGQIIVNYADRKAGEPFSVNPSVGVSKYFEITNRHLTEVKVH